MKISKITIIIENNDQTKSESSDIIPYEIADSIMVALIDWKLLYSSTIKSCEDFQVFKNEFIKKLDSNELL